MSSGIKNKTDIKVEILRIIACFAVIWYHIRELPWKSDGELSETAVFFEALCTICVMTFFLISGFFIYNKKGNIFKDWGSIILKFLKSVFLPFILVVIFCIIFHDFMISTDTFTNCIKNFSFTKIFNTLYDSFRHFSANYLPGTAAHLWYIFSYMIIILVYPITRFVLTKFNKIVVYVILAVITIFMIINDYYLFYDCSTYNIIFTVLHKPIYYSACGCVLYNDFIKKYLHNKDTNKFFISYKVAIISVIIYIVDFVLLFKTQCAYDLLTNGAYVYTSWLSTYSLVMTIAFVLFVYNINFDKFLGEKAEKSIVFVANRTLGVYLIHYLYITKFLSMGIQSKFKQGFTNILQHFIYFIIYGTLIFLISFITVLLIEFLFKGIKSLFKGGNKSYDKA